MEQARETTGTEAKLYSISLSHPARAARLMLEHKGIQHDVVNLLPGMHPLVLRAAGFRGGTVPALKIDGRRLQGSLSISRALEGLRPQPALFPSDPERRRAVEDAERWGERELQPVPRRLFRWALVRRPDLRRWMAAEIMRMPAPRLMARANAPLAHYFARKSGATDAGVRAYVKALPKLLDQVDALIAAGTIGGLEPNAADYQIGTSVRVLLAYDDLHGLVEGRPACEHARRVQPDYVAIIPPVLPPQWL